MDAPHSEIPFDVKPLFGDAVIPEIPSVSKTLVKTEVSNQAIFKFQKNCGATFATKPNLNEHMRTHAGKYKKIQPKLPHNGENPFKCDLCEYSSISSQHLREHMNSHPRKRPFKCKLCDFSCKNKRSLKKHMSRHTGEK